MDMATNPNRGNMRPAGRSPPFLAIGLFVALIILGFNYWTLSARNGEQANALGILEGELRLVNAQKTAVQKRADAVSDKVKGLEESVNDHTGKLSNKVNELAAAQKSLEEIKRESSELQIQVNGLKDQVANCEKAKTDIQAEVDKVKVAVEKENKTGDLNDAENKECDEAKCSLHMAGARDSLLDDIVNVAGVLPVIKLQDQGRDIGKYGKEEKLKQVLEESKKLEAQQQQQLREQQQVYEQQQQQKQQQQQQVAAPQGSVKDEGLKTPAAQDVDAAGKGTDDVQTSAGKKEEVKQTAGEAPPTSREQGAQQPDAAQQSDTGEKGAQLPDAALQQDGGEVKSQGPRTKKNTSKPDVVTQGKNKLDTKSTVTEGPKTGGDGNGDGGDEGEDDNVDDPTTAAGDEKVDEEDYQYEEDKDDDDADYPEDDDEEIDRTDDVNEMQIEDNDA